MNYSHVINASNVTELLFLIMLLCLALLPIVLLDAWSRKNKTQKIINDAREQLEIEKESDELLRFFLDARNDA